MAWKKNMDLSPDLKVKLDQFLADVERKAFQMAKLASGNIDEALDLVQDAMFEFVRRYAEQPREKWKALFYRILQSRITDWHRRSIVRKRFLFWIRPEEEQGKNSKDPLQNLADPKNPDPYQEAIGKEERKALEKAIRALPLRQQQAFLLRAWEEMDVAQAAFAMGCSEGSIKTHYFRAIHTLRRLWEETRL